MFNAFDKRRQKGHHFNITWETNEILSLLENAYIRKILWPVVVSNEVQLLRYCT